MSCLYVVATPIGHLGDITLRAIDTLKTVDIILAEDTRHTKTLLNHYQISTPIISLNEHNESTRLSHILTELKKGVSFALVSDAGTPLISDPGYLLVNTLKANSLPVIPVPGVSAAITALSVSGLTSNRFTFIGFLPSKPKQRLDTLKTLIHKNETLIFYESPKRVIATLKDIATLCDDKRQLCLAKELTKVFETIRTQPIDEVINWLEADPKRQKGEFVLLLEGAHQHSFSQDDLHHVITPLLTELSPAKAAKIAAKITGIDKKICYQYTLK